MAAPPARTEIADTYPNPSNAAARTGFGKLWDYATGLLGATGNAAEARAALAAQGNLKAIRVFNTSGTYTPTAGTISVVVTVVGGGAGGGGTPTTGAAQCSVGGGGGGGGWAKKRITSAFSGVTMTIGAGGTAAVNANGGGGGTTSFGALVQATGGAGGFAGTAQANTATFFGPVSAGGVGSSGDINGVGGNGKQGLFAPLNAQYGGGGGFSIIGDGAVPSGGYATGIGGTAAGSGGGGASSGPSAGTTTAGGVGAPGAIIVEEYA